MVGSLLCAVLAPAALGALSSGPEPAAWAPADAIRPQRLNAGLWGPADQTPVDLRPQSHDAGPAFPPETPRGLPLEACATPALIADEPAAMMLPAEPSRGFVRTLASG